MSLIETVKNVIVTSLKSWKVSTKANKTCNTLWKWFYGFQEKYDDALVLTVQSIVFDAHDHRDLSLC